MSSSFGEHTGMLSRLSLTALFIVLGGCAPDPVSPADGGMDVPLDDGGMPMMEDDGGWPSDGGTDGDPDDAGPFDAGPPPPRSVFFVGNSFTFGGPVPNLVQSLATYAGFEEPNIEYRAIGGESLEGHRTDPAPGGAPARVSEGWDAVVLQEHSVRPTDQLGDPEGFKRDAAWFYDLAKIANPDAEVVLYQTWARRFNHSYYPRTFADPAAMQAELRRHYRDAGERLGVRVAPVGDAWEVQLGLDGMREPPRLHDGDDYHAGPAGQYLNALVLYATLFRARADGLVPLNGLDEATATVLQASANTVTEQTGWGPRFRPQPIDDGAEVRVDIGPLWGAGEGWHALTETRGTIFDLSTATGAPSTARVTAWGFSGVQEGGRSDNALGLPADVSRDTLWVGTFDGHAAALGMEARVVVRGLPAGRYDLELFASRTGDDEGRGRLTRYRIADASVDLEVADNTDRVARFEDVRPDLRGEIVIRVTISPDGGARFAYAGTVRITRAGE